MDTFGSERDDDLASLVRSGDERQRLVAARRAPEVLASQPQSLRHLLEELLDDPSPVVRTAVADALELVSRTRPDLALEWAEAWASGDPTDVRRQLLRHGLRTLRTSGTARALRLMDDFGYIPSTSTP